MKPATAFISYADSDAEFAKRLTKKLRDVGISVWIDAEVVQPGAEWASAIREALESATTLIFVGSRASVNSVFSRKEVLWFFKQQRGPIYVLELESLELTPALETAFSKAKWIDFRYSYEDGLATLLAALPTGIRGSSQEKPRFSSKGYVFVSYAEEDLVFAERLTAFMGARGYAYWDFQKSDRNYHTQLYSELEEVIKGAAASLCVLSPSWKKSPWTVKEYLYSEEVGTPTFLLRAQALPPTLVIAGAHYIDFIADQEKGFIKLQRELKRKGL